MSRYIIRNVTQQDAVNLHQISVHLDSVNLPADLEVMREIIHISEQSFAGEIIPEERIYIFVVEDTHTQKLVATSQIIAKHGTPDCPHIYFEVLNEEKYSPSTGRFFQHKLLRLCKLYHGPTELAGLVVAPELRRLPAKLGKQISYVRFTLLAMFPALFQRNVIAELLPPFTDANYSLLWDSLGKYFTGMSYREADMLSRKNKEFIISLFPKEAIYTALLGPQINELIAQVGKNTQGAQNLLLDAGFSYQNHIDPFDGGPHLEACWPDILPIKNTREFVIKEQIKDGVQASGLVASFSNAFTPKARFVAMLSHFNSEKVPNAEQHKVELPQETLRLLQLAPGQAVSILAF